MSGTNIWAGVLLLVSKTLFTMCVAISGCMSVQMYMQKCVHRCQEVHDTKMRPYACVAAPGCYVSAGIWTPVLMTLSSAISALWAGSLLCGVIIYLLPCVSVNVLLGNAVNTIHTTRNKSLRCLILLFNNHCHLLYNVHNHLVCCYNNMYFSVFSTYLFS